MKVAEYSVHKGKRVLILAHREELLTQTEDKIANITGLYCAYEKAEMSSLNSNLPITVASVQTLSRETRLSNFDPTHYDVVIVDEAHRAIADSYQRQIQRFV